MFFLSAKKIYTRYHGNRTFNFYVDHNERLIGEHVKQGESRQMPIDIRPDMQRDLNEKKIRTIRNMFDQSYFFVANGTIKVNARGLGGWGKDIHKDTTIEWAKELGFSSEDARQIGKECDLVDTRPISNPLTLKVENQRWHFNTNDIKGCVQGSPGDSRNVLMCEHLKSAIRLYRAGDVMGAWFNLGSGLHPLQDIFAHRNRFVSKTKRQQFTHADGRGLYADNHTHIEENQEDGYYDPATRWKEDFGKNQRYSDTKTITYLYLLIFIALSGYHSPENSVAIDIAKIVSRLKIADRLMTGELSLLSGSLLRMQEILAEDRQNSEGEKSIQSIINNILPAIKNYPSKPEKLAKRSIIHFIFGSIYYLAAHRKDPRQRPIKMAKYMNQIVDRAIKETDGEKKVDVNESDLVDKLIEELDIPPDVYEKFIREGFDEKQLPILCTREEYAEQMELLHKEIHTLYALENGNVEKNSETLLQYCKKLMEIFLKTESFRDAHRRAQGNHQEFGYDQKLTVLVDSLHNVAYMSEDAMTDAAKALAKDVQDIGRELANLINRAPNDITKVEKKVKTAMVEVPIIEHHKHRSCKVKGFKCKNIQVPYNQIVIDVAATQKQDKKHREEIIDKAQQLIDKCDRCQKLVQECKINGQLAELEETDSAGFWCNCTVL